MALLACGRPAAGTVSVAVSATGSHRGGGDRMPRFEQRLWITPGSGGGVSLLSPRVEGVAVDELSGLSPQAANGAAGAARAGAAVLADAGERARSGREALGGWVGAAQDGFADRLTQLQGYLEVVTRTASAGAGVIEGYARELGMLKGRLAGIDAQLEYVQGALDRGVEDFALWESRWAELDHWTASRSVVVAAFDAASQELATRLSGLVDEVAGRPRRVGEQVSDAVTTVVGQVQGTGFLLFGWSWDGAGWLDMVRAVPGVVRGAVADPVGTAVAVLPIEELRDHRWGVAGASLGMAGLDKGLGRELEGVTPDHVERRGHLDEHGEPLPQSMPELLAGVDLERSEVFPGAHTIARHVEVDDEFLKQRLTDGTVEEGNPGRVPSAASRWTDLETANRVITETLRANEDKLNQKVAAGKQTINVEAPAPADSGVAWVKDGSEGFVQKPVVKCIVRLGRSDDGSWYVVTAYLEVAQ
ncbi:MAG: RNase A-like domain-containing protein [Janthinobacterium lividum]